MHLSTITALGPPKRVYASLAVLDITADGFVDTTWCRADAAGPGELALLQKARRPPTTASVEARIGRNTRSGIRAVI